MYERENRNYAKSKTIRDFIVYRLRISAVPYFLFGGITICFLVALDYIAGNSLKIDTRIYDLMTLKGIMSLWFISVYVLAELVMELTGRINKNGNKLRTYICLIGIIYITFFNTHVIEEVPILYKILIGIYYIEIGYLITKFEVLENVSKRWWLFLVIGMILARCNGSVEMNVNRLGNLFLYFNCATITSIAIMSLFRYYETSNNIIFDKLEVYGKNSIVLLCTNNIIIEIVRLLDYKITGNILISMGMIGSLLFTTMLLVLDGILLRWRMVSFRGCLIKGGDEGCYILQR